MAKTILSLGVALIVLGVGSYLLTSRESVTALIPAFFGLAFLGLGALAGGRSVVAIRSAFVLGVLGLAGSARGIPAALSLLTGGDVERPAAAVAQSLMAVLCLGFLLVSARHLRSGPPASQRSS
ncbi:MAG: hypothetical protein HKO53_02330 [Gemmatimonadetes bacterium]|nr:hypothetical protein [Gemmatimonadota bacterium]